MIWKMCYNRIRKEVAYMIFGKKRESSYNCDIQEPVVKLSICTGEKVAGFRDKETGHITEVMLIRDENDMKKFLGKYGVREEDIVRVW